MPASHGHSSHASHASHGQHAHTPAGQPQSAHPDPALAARLAHETGEVLLGLRRDWAPEAGTDQLRAAGNSTAHEQLMTALSRAHPGDAVLSEEGADTPERLDADRVWIVDPLDGTREYGEGRGDWAVHVALWVRDSSADTGGHIAAAAVALPVLGVTLTSDPQVVVPALEDRPPILVVSRSRPPHEAAAVVDALGGEQRAMGSAGAKVAAVLRGEADVYLHSGGQHEWDSAAPVAVALAAGMHASRLDGSPLVYNQPDPLLPDLLVCRQELADRVLTALAKAH